MDWLGLKVVDVTHRARKDMRGSYRVTTGSEGCKSGRKRQDDPAAGGTPRAGPGSSQQNWKSVKAWLQCGGPVERSGDNGGLRVTLLGVLFIFRIGALPKGV